MPEDLVAALTERIVSLEAEIEERQAELARTRRALGALRGDLTALHKPDTKDSMRTEHRISISQGRKGIAKGTERLLDAADAARHTLKSLAAAVGTNQPRLTRAAQGIQPISMELARKIEAALKVKGSPGYPANRTNWPKLQSDT